MRWKSLWGGVALLLAVIGGCKQRCFVTEDDLNDVTTSSIKNLDKVPDLACKPMTDPPKAPPTLYDLDRKVRFISLAEVIAITLEQGTVGVQQAASPGNIVDSLVQFSSGIVSGSLFTAVSGSDAIRVFALDPAAQASQIDQSLAKFDAVFAGSVSWNTTDQPIGTSLQTFQAGNQGINTIVQQDATGSMALFKPLANGGVAGITFNLPYTFTNLPSRVNPSYRPQLQFGFDTPLLQGFGTEINQLLQTHPVARNTLFQQAAEFQPGVDGILITRLRFDQQRAQFEALVNTMLLNVETAYWNLYGAYWTLYSREQGLRFAYESYRLLKAGFDAGRVKAAEYYQARGQYELFRAQRLQAVDQVLENERRLRALMGMPIEDGCRLMPSDQPTLAPYQPDWFSALQDALARRPELYLARQEVKVAQMALIRAKNSLLPDLRFSSTYDYNAVGTRLDGPDENNAFRNLSLGKFSSWALTLRYAQPIGFRLAHAQIRQQNLQLARSLEILKDQENKAARYLQLEYRQLASTYEQIRAFRSQRESYGEQLRASNEEYKAGRITLNVVLEAQRFWADALANEYNAIVGYNNALTAFEFAKGTILLHDNVTIAEGSLPECAQERASEHLRERTHALVLRERAAPPITPAAAIHVKGGPETHSLPQLLQAAPPLKDVPPMPPLDPSATTPPDMPAPKDAKPEELLPQPRPGKPGPAGSGGSQEQKPASSGIGTFANPDGPFNTLPRIGSRKASDFGTVREDLP
jgi:outer membrane protein TolC